MLCCCMHIGSGQIQVRLCSALPLESVLLSSSIQHCQASTTTAGAKTPPDGAQERVRVASVCSSAALHLAWLLVCVCVCVAPFSSAVCLVCVSQGSAL